MRRSTSNPFDVEAASLDDQSAASADNLVMTLAHLFDGMSYDPARLLPVAICDMHHVCAKEGLKLEEMLLQGSDLYLMERLEVMS